MAGHSHWRSIKYKKGREDIKRSQAFSKIARLISVAAREAGPNPETNSKLRMAIEQAKEFNMPSENIERAIKRGMGELEGGQQLEEILLEALGPGGIAIIIGGITDNKNRTLAEIKQILNRDGGKLVNEGAVRWMFERKGCIVINSKFQIINYNKEELELIAIEAGAQDLYWHNDTLDVYTKIEDLEKVKKILEEKGIKIDSATLDWVAKEEIELDEKNKQACQKLFDALDENEAVQEIYSNLKI